MDRLTQRENDKLIMVKQDNGEYIPVYWDEDNFKAIEKLAAYEDLEEYLHKIFGEESTFSLVDVIDALEMKLSEPDKKHPVNARILTYEEANKWQEYKDLEEHGLIMRLPDDLNRVLYQVNYRWTECTEYGEKNNECEIYDCECECDSRKEYYIAEVDLQYIPIGSYYNRLGKFLFLTREEAEKKLEEMKNDGSKK